ncbi:hypothetical protein SDRG_11273 [Saprolegnia diclina VS20]|uniref:Uncharacterized protein n=1 Tax=Saprolegnia diclina (strain VS20) TaxID=1156394 RepID=T0RFM1_SAPDV|nr:hypothetical protein SDRG_11273 [Saprolegnia diclina VS20]EQC31088.1 hypothetical protein SDRG_11273 [Saprolegnia diclina VS20]|eukprot:XP_008615527.1 hypothetical protein SDRG_11273 [Saprolegnia diclina VS20]
MADETALTLLLVLSILGGLTLLVSCYVRWILIATSKRVDVVHSKGYLNLPTANHPTIYDHISTLELRRPDDYCITVAA